MTMNIKFFASMTAAILLSSLSLYAQKVNLDDLKYVEATDLTIVGKLMPGKTANPYHRVDTTLYKGFTTRENYLVRMTSGMACCFKTNSRCIYVKSVYGQSDNPVNTNFISAKGYDLYVHDGTYWVWAGSGYEPKKTATLLVEDMPEQEQDREFLLYFPTYSEMISIKIGVEPDARITAVPNPFRHRIAIWGSSYTHGSSTSRAGMAYPAQLSRMTGFELLSLGCSGRCMLQDYFCDVLCDVEADAFIFDSFSNPKADMIKERLVPFIDRMIKAHPGVPLIFQQTIYRERRNFNAKHEAQEKAKMEMAASIFKEIKSTQRGREKYKDVYFIIPEACPKSHEASVDGVHPDNYGYTLWAESIKGPVTRILNKYGIK